MNSCVLLVQHTEQVAQRQAEPRQNIGTVERFTLTQGRDPVWRVVHVDRARVREDDTDLPQTVTKYGRILSFIVAAS